MWVCYIFTNQRPVVFYELGGTTLLSEPLGGSKMLCFLLIAERIQSVWFLFALSKNAYF